MEPPNGALTAQRALALLLLAAVLGAAVIEHGSPLAASVRDGKPWIFWLDGREPEKAVPAIHLGVYDPVRRVLVLIRLPEQTRLEGKLTLGRAYRDALRSGDAAAATRAVEDLAQERISTLSLQPIDWNGAGHLGIEPVSDDGEPEVAAARSLAARGESPRDWAALVGGAARGLYRGDRTAADPLLLALELRRAPIERLEPALFPDEASAPGFLARVFAPPPSEDDGRAPWRASAASAHRAEAARPIVVEVLNGTDRQGLATQAAKMLRSRGLDVTSLGAAPKPRARTVIYDRTGRFASAARVREALGCKAAVATTRIDALRGVDASVELGSDCADAVAGPGKRF